MERLIKPVSVSPKVKTIVGIIFSVILSLCVGELLYNIGDLGIIAAAVASVLFGVCLFFKPFKEVFRISPAGVLLCIVITWGVHFRSSSIFPDKSAFITRLNSVCFFAGCLVFVLCAYSALCQVLGSVKYKNEKDGLTSWKSNYLPVLLTTLAFFFTTLIFVPSDSYMNNYKNFVFLYKHFIFNFIIDAAVYIIVIPFAVCSFSKLVCRIYCAVMCGLTVCVYVQCSFLNGSLQLLMGEEIDLSEYTSQKIISAAVWILLIALPIVLVAVFGHKNKKIFKGVVAAPMFVFAVELSTLIVMLVSNTGIYSYHDYVLTGKDQFTVSGKKNVVTFIIDEGDLKYFNEVRDKNPEKFSAFKDFTYYTNYTTKYDSTNLAVPQLLTESDLLPETTVEDWYDKIWNTDKVKEFYDRLHKNDYNVNVYSTFSNSYNILKDRVDNLEYLTEDSVEINTTSAYNTVKQLSMYRMMPFVFKEDYGRSIDPKAGAQITNGCIFDNEPFEKNMQLEVSGSDKNYFIVEHILGTHQPVHTGDVISEAEFCLDLVGDYMRQMKEKGLYDDALIIVTADHGKHVEADFPIFMVKEPGRTADKMQISDKPLSMDDYFATCLINMGLYDEKTDKELFGTSIYDWKDGDKRERIWFARQVFKYVGEVDFKKSTMGSNSERLYGYTFTGDEKELQKQTSTRPPDTVLELDESYG